MYIIVFVTCVNNKEANLLAGVLVNKRLAACVNIVDKIKSIFHWQGRVDSAKESLLIIKSKKTQFPKIVKLVKSLHSYEVPEIIAIPILSGETRYLRWMNESLR